MKKTALFVAAVAMAVLMSSCACLSVYNPLGQEKAPRCQRCICPTIELYTK